MSFAFAYGEIKPGKEWIKPALLPDFSSWYFPDPDDEAQSSDCQVCSKKSKMEAEDPSKRVYPAFKCHDRRTVLCQSRAVLGICLYISLYGKTGIITNGFSTGKLDYTVQDGGRSMSLFAVSHSRLAQ